MYFSESIFVKVKLLLGQHSEKPCPNSISFFPLTVPFQFLLDPPFQHSNKARKRGIRNFSLSLPFVPLKIVGMEDLGNMRRDSSDGLEENYLGASEVWEITNGEVTA